MNWSSSSRPILATHRRDADNAAAALPRDYAHASNDSPIPARRGASLPLAVRPIPVTRPANRTAVPLVIEEPSGADRDDVIDLVGRPPASRTPNLADVAVTLEDSLPDPPPMAVVPERPVLSGTHDSSPASSTSSEAASASTDGSSARGTPRKDDDHGEPASDVASTRRLVLPDPHRTDLRSRAVGLDQPRRRARMDRRAVGGRLRTRHGDESTPADGEDHAFSRRRRAARHESV
jgi:hypothetical protein